MHSPTWISWFTDMTRQAASYRKGRVLSDRMAAAGLLGPELAAGRPVEITLAIIETGPRLAGWIRERRRAVLAHELGSMSADGRQALARGLSELAGHQVRSPRDATPRERTRRRTEPLRASPSSARPDRRTRPRPRILKCASYLGRDPALLVMREGGMGALRAAQGCSGHIGALQMATLENPPGLAIAGEIDEDTYPALVEKLSELAWGRDEVHVDLTAVQYCDLAGLRAIVRPVTTGRKVVLHGLPAYLQTVLSILGWDRTPGLVIDNSPLGSRLPPADPDPKAVYAKHEHQHARPTDRRIG